MKPEYICSILKATNLAQWKGRRIYEPTRGRIAALAGVPRSTAYRYIKKLFDAGLMWYHPSKERGIDVMVYVVTDEGNAWIKEFECL